ncbi:MAG TPA: Ig-like domain-containing protein [Gemmatimonadales bacterium]|nr:Ig-like domain-containing protein [Gemmatimonadales bacterium]
MKCGADISGEQGSVATAMMPAAQERDEHEVLLGLLKQATIGDYEILTELGRGGMATVYLAHDIALDRKVAIKMMAPALMMMGEGMVERFKREARTSASLSHPHIIPIYGVKSQGKTLFFIMKFIAGRSLESIIRDRGAMPLPMVRAVLQQVGSALGYAHRRGVVHRDVKPANIMIDEEGWAVVTDFGIAKVAESRGLTMTGIAVGTPSYMSPEQCAAKDITGKSDQYSLGCVAYEMLTGKQPFEADSAMAIMFAHFHEKPKPIGELRKDCPVDLAAAVMRMMEKPPDARWPSMEEAIGAIGAAPLSHDDPIRLEMIELARRGTARLKLDAVPVPPTSPAPLGRPSDKTTPIPPPRITSVAIAPASSSVMVGDTMQLTATPRAGGGTTVPSPIKWSSSDAAVAEVSSTGLVTALAPGSVTITAACDDVKGTASVTVTPVPVASIVIAPAEKKLHPGESAQLEVVLRDPRDAPLKDRPVEWRSEAPDKVTVSATGKVSAIAEGTARITATAEGKSGSATIQVVPMPVATVLIGGPPELAVGDAVQLNVTLKDAKGGILRGRAITWSSSDSKIATVSPSGLTTALTPGKATITVESEGQRATHPLNIKPAPVGSVTVESPGSIVAGETAQLNAVLRDSRGAVLIGRQVKWTSATPKVATVSDAGLVTAVDVGGARITCESEGKSTTVNLTVVPRPVAKLNLGGIPGALKPGETAKLSATAVDNKGNPLPGREITWISSDAKVLTVAKDGTVTAKADGTAKIVAACEGKQADASIRVMAPPPPPPPPPPKVEPPTLAEPAASDAATVILPRLKPEPPKPAPPKPAPEPAPVAAPVVAEAPVAAPDETVEAAPPRKSKVLVFAVLALLLAAGAWWAIRNRQPVPAPVEIVTPPPVGPAAVAAIELRGTNGPIAPGRTLQLAALIKDDAGKELTGRPLAWTSSDPSVAEVAPSGAVTARKPGSAMITATSEGKSATATVTVVAPDSVAPTVAVASMLLGPTPSALEVGGTAVLRATPRDDRGKPLDDRAVVWASSDPSVATVSSSGVVSAVAPGNATITASSEGKSSVIKVTVNAPKPPPPPAKVEVAAVVVASKTPSIKVGETTQLSAAVTDRDRKPVTDRSVEWTTSDPKVATVSSTGVVSAVGEGTATITATVEGKTSSTRITVPKPPEDRVAVTSIALTAGTRSLKVGETTTWTAAARDSKGKDLTDRQIVWSSSNPQVVTVSSSGVMTAVGAGTAQVEALSEGKVASAEVTVTAPPAPPPPPVATGTNLPRRALAAGTTFSCGITQAGSAVCWGGGREGFAAVAGVSSLSSVGVGSMHACGLAGGKAYCWGSNKVGQLGDGATADHQEAAPVAGDLTFSMITVGSQHTCGLVGTKAWCWGKNDKGQLGDGTTTDRRKPVQVKGTEAYAALSAGGGHTCGLTTAGKAYCWGDGWSGALGYGSQGAESEARSVDTELKFSRIATGTEHSCGLSVAGKVLCWGGNKAGQLGDGSTNDRSSPVAVSTTLTFVEVSAGGSNSCALDPSGAAYCWGDNKSGQVGDGSKNSRNKPAPVGGGLTYSALSVGNGYSCGLTKAGDPVCWGKNDKGQLGSGGPRSQPGPVE